MPRAKRWSGAYVVLWSDGSWEFFRCCRCGQPLNDPAARRRGLGPTCVKSAPLDCVRLALKADRRRYRRDREFDRMQALLRVQRAA